jgi:hypothetical protein
MKRLALACACGAALIWAAPQVHAQVGPKGRPQDPVPGSAPVRGPGAPDKDRDRRSWPGYVPRPLYLPTPQVRPGPTGPHVGPIAPSFRAPPVTEFHPPFRPGGAAGEVGGGVIAALGAALAGAFRALFGFRRKQDGESEPGKEWGQRKTGPSSSKENGR